MALFSRSSWSAFALVFLGLVGVPGLGCSSSGSNGSGSTPSSSGSSGAASSGAQTVSADDCARRCESKLTACGADAANAKSACAQQVCGGSVTGDQLTCLDGKSCEQISGSASFSALCPASTGNPQPTPPAAASCGKATCTSSQYCDLGYDSSASTWSPSSCKSVPPACAGKGGAELCTCMKENAGCPKSGVVSTKCSQADGALSFGCH
jgi:hypothetical protein